MWILRQPDTYMVLNLPVVVVLHGTPGRSRASASDLVGIYFLSPS
jgi:hypothetical protein